MPKRSSSGRSGSQRQRTRTQKSVELLRPISEEDTTEAVEEQQQVKESVATATATPETSQLESSKSDRATTASSESVETPKSEPAPERKPEAGSRSKASSGSGLGSKKSSSSTLAPTSTATTPETVSTRAGSASARIAAKRQATQRPQRAVSLITPEHFTYVRRDLIFIAILAVIMIAAIIALYFVLGR